MTNTPAPAPNDDRRLVRVYLAADPADARLVAQWLEQNGIEATVQGELMWAARGEIPVGPSTGPSVWTWEEQAVACTLGTWRGVVAPPGLTSSQIDNWEEAIMAAVLRAEWRAALDRHLWTPTVLDAAATRAFHDQQARLLSAALTDLGLVTAGHG